MTDTRIISSVDALERALEAGDRYRELRDMPESRRADSWDQERRQAAQALLEANTELDVALRIERSTMERLAFEHAVANPPAEARGPQAAFAELGRDVRSAGEQFIESRGGELRAMGDAEGIEVRNLLTGSSIGTSGSHLFAPVGSPTFYGQPRRQRFFLRDVLTVQPTGLQSVPYIREVDAATNEGGASAVKEASAKPEVTMEWEQDDAPARKIAAWIQATYEALADAPTLRGYIDGRLGYMLQVREEALCLTGNGTAPNLKGIMSFTSGNTQLQTTSDTGDLFADVGTAIGLVESVDGDANAVAVNPLDYWAAMTDRQSTFFDGNANGSAPFGTPGGTIWGLPAIRTRAIASGTTLVGDFANGATLFEREGTVIRTTDSHASLFISNTWVVLAEERVALAVHRPDFFVKIS